MLLIGGPSIAHAQAVDAAEVRQLIEENHRLQAQVAEEAKTIEALRQRVEAIDQTGVKNREDLASLRSQISGDSSGGAPKAAAGEQAVRISAEVGFAFFMSGSDGNFANGEFRVDDAKVFLEAPVWKNVFFHSELDLITREASDNGFHLGEIYADVEDLPGGLSLRFGRTYTPFGEEYQERGVLENDLISHSVADIWGMDEGLEVFGQTGQWSYIAAVQDGGINTLRNFHPNKSVAGRLGFDPAKWLHLSASAMRTGRLSTSGDQLSALWFGNGFFHALGSTATTQYFWADLFELDGTVRWKTGHIEAMAGAVRFDDNNATLGAKDARHMTYYSVEARQNLTDPLYAAVRYSTVRVPGGYMLEGQGTAAEYFFSGTSSRDLSRVSAGLGYQFGPPLVLKVEFSPEWGQTTKGANRNEENLFSTELGLKF